MPEWYTAGRLPPERQPAPSVARDVAGLRLARSPSPDVAPSAPQLENWDILSGGDALADCPDTVICLLLLQGTSESLIFWLQQESHHEATVCLSDCQTQHAPQSESGFGGLMFPEGTMLAQPSQWPA